MVGKKRERDEKVTAKRTSLEEDQAEEVYRAGLRAANNKRSEDIAAQYGIRGHKKEDIDYSREATDQRSEQARKKTENSTATEKHKENAVEIAANWGNDLWKIAADTYNSVAASTSAVYSFAANYLIEKAINSKESVTHYAQSKGITKDASSSTDAAPPHVEQGKFKTAMRDLREADKKATVVMESEEGYTSKGLR